MLIAIVGGSGAGKTTVANLIHKRISVGSCVLSMDYYYKDLEPTQDPKNINFDSPMAFDFESFKKDLLKLKNGEDIEINEYSFSEYKHTDEVLKIKSKPIIIVEGILPLYNEEVRKLFDFSIYIEAPSDERFIRRLLRDIKERGRTIDSVINQYRKYVMPAFTAFIEPQKYYCNMIFPWHEHNMIGLEMIISSINTVKNS